MGFRELADYLWPTASNGDAAEVTKLNARCRAEKEAVEELRDHEGALLQALESSLALFAAERERLSSVDTRLGGVLSLASVATALVLASVTFLTRKESGEALYVSWSVWLIAGIGTYTVAQLLNALRAAVRGLARRSVAQDDFLSLLPEGKEVKANYTIRVLKGHATTRRDLTLKIDAKVTCMAVAHRALLNATGAMVLAALGLFIVTVQRTWTRGRHPTADISHVPPCADRQ